MDAEKVPFLRKDHPAVEQGVGGLLLIGGTEQTRLRGRGHIDAVAMEPPGDSLGAILIQMEVDRLRRVPSVP
jgi:hypothetical protein